MKEVISLKINIKKIFEFIITFSCKFTRVSLIFYLLFFKIIPIIVDIIIFRYYDKYSINCIVGIVAWTILLFIFRIPKLPFIKV
jgi:RsiW-degrading membrane proteinase PrsW (M82 family)